MIYCIQAQVVKAGSNGYRSSTGIPTFFLDADIQGIVDAKHAEEIARRILNPFGDDAIEVHAYAAVAEYVTK